MSARLVPGAAVQTPFGKGVVREVRNAGRLLVEVQGRSLVLRESEVSAIDARGAPPRTSNPAPRTSDPTQRFSAAHTPPDRSQIDLHGLTVEQALARAEEALNDALLAGAPELRIIHGRSGGRIRAALHAWLRRLPSVRAFSVDARNPGATIVRL